MIRVLSSLVPYPIFWGLRWDNRRLKRKLAKLEKQE